MKKLALALSLALALAALGAAGGTPAMDADDGHGYYLWFDGDRFQLRTTDRGNGPGPSVYTGRITTDGVFSRVDVVRGEADDWAVAGPRQIDFHFRTYNAQDGVAFRVDGGDRVTFRLYRDGHLIRTDHIFIGAGEINPPSNPFAILH